MAWALQARSMGMRACILLLLLSVILPDASASLAEHTVQLGKYTVGLSMRGPAAFRVRMLPQGGAPFQTPMVDPAHMDAKFETFADDYSTGIHSSIGTLSLTHGGSIVLRDLAGRLLTKSEPIHETDGRVVLSTKQGKLYGKGAAPPDGFQLTSDNVQPLVCNTAAYTPYYYSTDGYGALAATNASENSRMPVSYRSDGKRLTWTTWASSTSDWTCHEYQWGQDNEWCRTVNVQDGIEYKFSHGDGSCGDCWCCKRQVRVGFGGGFELYLLPAPTLAEGTRSYYELIGKPAVLPRYAFGFGASRWGWESRQYMEDVMTRFRSEKFPIDYIIVDFEWFVTETDYDYKPEGKPDYMDFGYNPKLFDEPQKQLATYKNDYHIRFAGIRKPRIGNTDSLNTLRAKGWILDYYAPGGGYPATGHYADERCVNYSNPDARAWYSQEMAHYTEDGVSFWWNDEGETDYFTYHWWNVAESDAVRSKAPEMRFWSLNRGFSPGMARLGAAAWTGDVSATWPDLKRTPGMMLNWILGGAPYVACDIGGFLGDTNGVLLTRWIQVGAFMPIMRVHSVISAVPHFPWNFGDEAAGALRTALELRYRLVPYHYSLAHALYRTHAHWVKPLVMEYPEDAESANIVTEWMDGRILVAPIVREDGEREVYLPPGTWYLFGPTPDTQRSLVLQGGQRLGGRARLDEVPAFVRAGSVVPLAPVVQHTDALPGGALEVQVYAGADASFDLVEDDGESTAYSAGQAKTTTFRWTEWSRTLSWTVHGVADAAGDKAFKEFFITLFDQEETSIIRTDTKELASGGTVTIDRQTMIVT